MRKFILPILLLHLTVAVNAATYYFSSSSGDDSRSTSQAQSSSTPWQSIGKLNAIMSSLQPGDQVLFKSGDTFTGAINVTVSGTSGQPITFSSYGSGSSPVISGFSSAANWTQVRGNVWEAPFWQPNGAEGMVVMNNQQQGIGRYPNSNASNGGYLTINSNNGSTQLTSTALPSSPNWTGADVVIRKNRWTLDRSTISSHSGTTLNFASGSYNTITNNYGFFIVNSTNTLDQNGEWYYDNSRSKLQMYFSNNNPNVYTVQASTVETLVTISFQNYITFSNISFTGANSYAFNLTNSNNITIINSSISFIGIDGVQALSSNYLIVQNTSIANANNIAINCYWGCNNVAILNDQIGNTGLIAGMGQNGNAPAYEGIYVNGNNNLVQYCELDSTGYDGIHFEGDNDVVRNNFINTFGFVVDDCGGIYTGQGTAQTTVYNSRSILYNIILNGVGATAGTDNATYIATQGVYLDDNTNHTAVMNNTVANCGQAGIFNHNSYFTNISNNTLYNNGKAQFLFVRQINPVSSVTVQNNIMFAKTATQLASRMESYSGNNDLSQIGNEDNNYYCRPIDNNYMFYDMYEVGTSGNYVTSYETLATWQSKFGLDGNSQSSPGTIPSFTSSNASGMNLFPNGSFTSNADNVGVWSPIGDGTVSWLPGGKVQLSASNYSSTTNSFYTTLTTNSSVTAGSGHLLTFNLQGAAAGSSMTVYLRQGSAPYGPMSTSTMIPIPTTAQNVQFGFTPTVSGPVSIEMDIVQPTGAVLLDNVVLQQATITQTNPDDYIVFAYNPSTSNMNVNIPSGTYLDATGKQYTNSTTLQPYTSIVLFQQTSGGSTNSVAQQSIALDGNLVDASANSTISSAATKLNWKVDNQNSTASYYEVERASDAKNFTSIGKATVKTNDASSVTYQYSDASPLAGKNYYRITQHNNKDSASSTSKIVVVNNISFKINPNPAKDVIHLSFDEMINAADHLDKDMAIRNAAGVTVQTVRLPSTDNLNRIDINVAALQRGVYILSVSSDGKAFSKTFIKE